MKNNKIFILISLCAAFFFSYFLVNADNSKTDVNHPPFRIPTRTDKAKKDIVNRYIAAVKGELPENELDRSQCVYDLVNMKVNPEKLKQIFIEHLKNDKDNDVRIALIDVIDYCDDGNDAQNILLKIANENVALTKASLTKNLSYRATRKLFIMENTNIIPLVIKYQKSYEGVDIFDYTMHHNNKFANECIKQMLEAKDMNTKPEEKMRILKPLIFKYSQNPNKFANDINASLISKDDKGKLEAAYLLSEIKYRRKELSLSKDDYGIFINKTNIQKSQGNKEFDKIRKHILDNNNENK